MPRYAVRHASWDAEGDFHVTRDSVIEAGDAYEAVRLHLPLAPLNGIVKIANNDAALANPDYNHVIYAAPSLADIERLTNTVDLKYGMYWEGEVEPSK